MIIRFLFLCFLSFFLLSGCSVRSDGDILPTPLTESTGPSVPLKASGSISMFIPEKIDRELLLVNNIMHHRVYLMEKGGAILHEWNLSGSRLGNDATLRSNGGLLTSLKVDRPITPLGGVGGLLAKLDRDGNSIWSYDTALAGTGTVGHHDLLELASGNILALIWEKIPAEKTSIYGYKLENNIFPEKIIELDPETGTIVWEWRSLDHIVQDHDRKARNYGDPAKQKERIDINYMQSISGAVMHANGLAYDEASKLIFLSVNNFSEVWVIDHSTTILEARGSTGGTYGKGGDLIYRFGNPSASRSTGERLFYSNHHPNFTLSGTLMIFSNGNGAIPAQSSVYELELPRELFEGKIPMNPPKIIWSYTHPDLSYDKIGGALRLSNGNTLITEGDGVLWEITPEKEIAWKYTESGALLWRTYAHGRDEEGVRALGITR